MTRDLHLIALQALPEVEPDEDLSALILQAAGDQGIEFADGDVLAVAQKVVSKAEGRSLDLSTVEPTPMALDLAAETGKDPRLVELILQESSGVVRSRPGLIIVQHRLGFVCANAGVDRSNVPGSEHERVLLLPLDPDASARAIGKSISAVSGAEVGVLIVDSHGRPWRLGTVGVAIGVYRVPVLVDLRGSPDREGRRLEITQIGLADELAAAASILFGQADEGTPVVHIRGLPYPLRASRLSELIRPREEDLFR